MSGKIYLDNAATTPLDPRVLKIMLPFYRQEFGNPGSLHSFGQKAVNALDRSREKIAAALGADFREIIFTASATEANNLALRGTVSAFRRKYPRITPRLIVSSIEHESVLQTARALKAEGVDLVILPVDKEGFVRPADLTAALNAETALVSIMYANNEIGTVEPVAAIARTVAEFREKENKEQNRSIDRVYPLVHTDAVQAFQFLSCDVRELGVDMLTISAHKIYGPKGIGALYRKQIIGHEILEPVITGGGQEFGMRSGTENVAAIAGFGEAVILAAGYRHKEEKRQRALLSALWRELRRVSLRAVLHGPPPGQASSRLPNILNVGFEGVKAEELLTYLDRRGIAASSGSACAARSAEPSHVLLALGRSEKEARASVRLSFGRTTGMSDMKKLIAAFRSFRKD